MGPPPPPPPPPLLLSSTTLPSGGWKTTQTPRRDNNSTPATSNKTRPTVDSAALQHAASRLRKTGYYEQIRGDVPNLPDARVAGTNQRLPDRDRSHGTQFEQLGSNSSREQIHAAPTNTYHTDSLGDIRGCAHPGLKTQNNGMPSTPTTFSGVPRNLHRLSNNPLSESFIENNTANSDEYANRNFLSCTAPSQKYRNLSPTHASAPLHNDILPQTLPQESVNSQRSYSPRSYPAQRSSPNRTFNSQTYTTKIIHQHQPIDYTSTASLEWNARHIPSSSPILNPRALIHQYATQNYVEPDPPRGYEYAGTAAREMRNHSYDFATSIRNQMKNGCWL
ncbi:hypothetical protein KIN20_031782 [Parelaphostrongylus tenuis]|uniref:Uncharacterized protein n=1 Tax=Parelaphostrongylus tenuis TaxID=148309 RepID=A0AAD5R7F0_PARTN|nr:hypothetical protein KIN20_031782 [Parelaphostrongylus tenuis]